MKLFVWDFHGVLEKDNDLAVLDISNNVLRLNGYKERFTKDDNHAYYGLKWYEYFERLLPQLSNEKHMALQADCFTYAEEHLDALEKHIKPNDYALTVLKAINKAGHDQILLSNTRTHDLLWFVKTVGLTDYLPEAKIIGVNAHQKLSNKVEALKQYLKNKKFESIVIIGDSESDMSLKEVGGGTTYFYMRPNRDHEKIIGADYKIESLLEVLREV